jgi:hypothetical protein
MLKSDLYNLAECLLGLDLNVEGFNDGVELEAIWTSEGVELEAILLVEGVKLDIVLDASTFRTSFLKKKSKIVFLLTMFFSI